MTVNKDKTCIVAAKDGLDFLGCTFGNSLRGAIDATGSGQGERAIRRDNSPTLQEKLDGLNRIRQQWITR